MCLMHQHNKNYLKYNGKRVGGFVQFYVNIDAR